MKESKISIIQKFKIIIIKWFIQRFMPPPLKANHWEYSCFFSADDDFSKPSERLLDIASLIVSECRNINLLDISNRFKVHPINPNPNVWPGEHYKLLAAIVKIINPKLIIEIGTSIGTSSLSLKKYLSKDGRIITFDIIPWHNLDNTLLKNQDFEDGRLIQFTDDLSKKKMFMMHSKLFEEAELIFIDAKKDGIMERLFLDYFELINFKRTPIIIFDDIKHWHMLKIWREISFPKLDITSFGHFTGTGIIDWQNKH